MTDEQIGASDAGASSSSIVCPVCGAECIQEKCEVICTSERCVHRVVMNCSEF